MQKAFLLVGPPGSGKSSLANEHASNYKPKEVVTMCMQNDQNPLHPYFFQRCNKSTKLVVIEQIRSMEQLKHFATALSAKIVVRKRGEPDFELKAYFVCTFQSDNYTDISEIADLDGNPFSVVFCSRHQDEEPKVERPEKADSCPTCNTSIDWDRVPGEETQAYMCPACTGLFMYTEKHGMQPMPATALLMIAFSSPETYSKIEGDFKRIWTERGPEVIALLTKDQHQNL